MPTTTKKTRGRQNSPSPDKKVTKPIRKSTRSIPPKVAAKPAKLPKAAKKVRAKSIVSSEEDIIDQNSNGELEVTYKAGTFLAFIDPSAEDLKDYKIARVATDATSESLTCDVFKAAEKTPFEFKLLAKNQTVFDHSIISEIKAEILKATGKKNPVAQLLKCTKTQHAKICKSMPAIIEAVKAHQSDEDSDVQEDPSSSSSDEEPLANLTQDIIPRRVLKIKGVKKQAPAATQATVQKKSKSKSAMTKVVQDTEMQIDSTVDKKGKKAPQVGKKRRMESVDQDDEGDQSDDAGARKQRKIGTGDAERVEAIRQARPAPKKPVVFKLGKWNPDHVLDLTDAEKESKNNSINKVCCTRCTNRNVIRAALTGNVALLKDCITSKSAVTNLNAHWGPEDQKTAAHVLFQNNNLKLLEQLLHPKLSKTKTQTYAQVRDDLLSTGRSTDDQYLMNIIQTGRVSHMAYGAHVRNVQMTRGNRQGNNAFLEYADNNKDIIESFRTSDQEELLKGRLLSVEALGLLQKILGGSNADQHGYDIIQQLSSYLHHAIRAGDYKLVAYAMKDLVQHSHYGFNELHLNVLQDYAAGTKLPEFKSINVTKKAGPNLGITPLHCACINPDTSVLDQLLQVNPDFNMLDNEMRRPIHYAAACESTANLQFLLDKGANLGDIDNRKTTCLHVAAMAGRSDNVKFILSKTTALTKLRDKANMTAMGWALKNCDLESIKALLATGEVKVNQGVGRDRIQPLGWAAKNGDYELTQWLIDNKARVQSGDKYKRTALTMAIRNGHIKVASLLLQFGADWNQPDSSGNTPLHFAAAYGWMDCMELFLKAGADINAENSWRVTPINIAMLKNHEGCVKKLLEHPEVDVNCKDEKGRTLLTLSLLDLNERTVNFVKYLLEKGADPNLPDVDERVSLHYLAKSSTAPTPKHWNDQRTPEQIQAAAKAETKRKIGYQLQIADLLLAKGASQTLRDTAKQTPFSVGLDHDNIDLLQKLIKNVTLNKDAGLLHALTSKILNQKYQNILFQLLENEHPTPETMNILNMTGLSPFLAYIEHFCSNYVNLRGNVLSLINLEASKHKARVELFQITNEDIFKPAPDNSQDHGHQQMGGYGGFGGRRTAMKARPAYHSGHPGQFNPGDVVQMDFPAEKQNSLADKLMKELVVEPFIKCLQIIVSKGADATKSVQKLERFRDILAERRMLAIANKLAIPEEAKVSAGDEKIMKREEVLKKRAVEKAGKKTKKDKQMKPAEVECEYHETLGLQNAFHLVTSCPHPSLCSQLIDFGVDPDTVDYKRRTPFNLASTKNLNIDHETTTQDGLMTCLISQGVRVDYADAKGRTPFLNYFADNRKPQYEQLLGLGVNTNQMDVTGLFALKYALIRRDNDTILNLVQNHKANINQIDNKGRNLLHHAVNMSSASADATFETEQQLIELGININLRDRHNRTPLHYAFVKIKDWRNISNIDPIETVSSLCGCRGLEMDVQDNWMKTPFHYAAQRGASICQIYLNKRGVNKERVDIYGNTPLGVSLLAKHHNSAIIMIQKDANVRALVYKENPEKVAKEMKELEKKKLKAQGKNMPASQIIDQEMHASDTETEIQDEDQKQHRHLFDNGNNNVGYDSEYDDEDEDDDDEDSDDQFEANAFNNQNAFNQHVFQGKSYKKVAKKASPAAFGGRFGATGHEEVKPEVEASTEPQTMFRMAINHGQQGLAYSMLDEGYNLMQAMQDAMDEKKFQLCLTLLMKYPDDGIVQQKNSKGQNLFHVLCQNSQGCRLEHLQRIYQTLKKRGVDCLEQDALGCSSLHYAVESGSKELVSLLLEQGASPVLLDAEGNSPLTRYLAGAKCKSLILYNPVDGKYDEIFESLANKGADMNLVYKEKSLKSENGAVYRCTPVINFIRQLSGSQLGEYSTNLRAGLRGLLQFGAKLNIADSEGRDVMAYAVMSNNFDLAQFFLQNITSTALNVASADLQGKTAIHHLVNPCKFGSYENVKLLDALHRAGYNANTTDVDGKRPIDYAKSQRSGVLLKKLSQLTNETVKVDTNSFKTAEQWPAVQVNYEDDSTQLMVKAQAKEEAEADASSELKELVPVDAAGAFERSYKVYCEGRKPWDAYLTKVDLRNGVYGDFVFYKLQMLHDKVRDLYVVFTRWGRIGETGMNQRTPFTKVDEAQKEFCTIFKQKTGNDFNELDKFERAKKKYAIARVRYVSAAHRDYLAPFDFEKCPQSALEKNTRQLLEEIGNVAMYQKAMGSLGLDTEVLPISGVSKEVLVQAQAILKEIASKVDEDQEICKKGMQADLDELMAVRDKIQDLSSRFYELIPLSQYKNQIAPPLNNTHQLKKQFDTLNSLVDIERASKMLLGALFRQEEMHPVDYLHKALNIDIQYLSPTTAEFGAIKEYVSNGAEGSVNFKTHKLKVFKIERKGEAENMQEFSGIGNKKLLYHGSSMFNFLGILSQGLRIAPPEAPATGYMFGKGLYFADMYGKSANYSGGSQESTVLLLCDVQLGKMQRKYQAENIERLPNGFKSIHGVGRKGPDHSNSLVHPEGIQIPSGPVSEYNPDDYQVKQQAIAAAQQQTMWGNHHMFGNRQQSYIGLGNNEFVVYNTSQVQMRYILQVCKKTKEEMLRERQQ